MILPKPLKVQRVSKPLRRVPVQRGKVDKPRKRLPKVKKTSRGKMGRLADKLFSLIVRSRGACAELACFSTSPIQCAHIVSRTYRSVRWSEDNAFALCASCHVFYTHRPLEWERFVTDRIGAADYASLKARALAKWDGDIDGVLVRLAARAVSMGIEAK